MPVVYGGTPLRTDGTMTGKRLAALIGLRDLARRVLQSQNEGWPEADRDQARRDLNWAYDRFAVTYGPINKTTFSDTKDGSVIRRMPNLVKFREDPDAMLVMSLEDYDEVTGKAAKAAIMQQDVVGNTPAVTSVATAEEGLLVSLNQRGARRSAVYQPALRQARRAGHRRTGRPDLSATRNRKPGRPPTPIFGQRPRTSSPPPSKPGRNLPAMPRPCEPCSPKTCCRAISTPVWARRGYPKPTSRRSPPSCSRRRPPAFPIGHLKKDAVWSVDAGYAAEQSVAATSEFGTRQGQRHLALGPGPQHEVADDL